MPATPVLAGQQRARADQISVSNPAAWRFPSGERGREGREPGSLADTQQGGLVIFPPCPRFPVSPDAPLNCSFTSSWLVAVAPTV